MSELKAYLIDGSPGLSASLIESPESIKAKIAEVSSLPTRSKRCIPCKTEQTIRPDAGYLLSTVVVEAIPENYGLISYNGCCLTVS